MVPDGTKRLSFVLEFALLALDGAFRCVRKKVHRYANRITMRIFYEEPHG